MRTKTTRPLHEIAQAIRMAWTKPNYAAKPYLAAMSTLDTPSDYYGQDSGRSIVNYFLANATSWRGEEARLIKTELKTLLTAAKR
jgi:hypothetical protein